MPTTDNPLLDILQVTEEWKQLARDQVDEIGSWRDADEADRWYQYWVGRGLLPDRFCEPKIPCRLAALNIRIQSWMLQRAPHLDVSALQKVYWYVSVWHADHNAERLPEQREIQAALEQALIVACSVEAAAYEIEKNMRTPTGNRANQSEDPTSECAVRLSEEGEPVHVFGREKPPLSPVPHAILKVMVEMYPHKWHWDAIVKKAKRPTAVPGVLKKLRRKDNDWLNAISLPGKPHGGYGLRNMGYTPESHPENTRKHTRNR